MAIGQSIGNPPRSKYETAEMMERHSAKIIADPDDLEKVQAGVVEVAWSYRNINWYSDGIARLCVQLWADKWTLILYNSAIDRHTH